MPSPDGATALPFSIHEDAFRQQWENGLDLYAYDQDSESVSKDVDGVNEILMYPGDHAPGNFGLLNIGTPNQSTPALEEQITTGVSAADLEAELGVSELTFYDEDGNPRTYEITGNPGFKAALEDSITARVGTLVAFFLHDNVVENGANSVYNITAIKFGRLMDVQLRTAESARGMWIQPVFYTGPGVIVDPNAPPSNEAAQLMLVR